MATKEIINFKGDYEEIEQPASPANHQLSREAAAKIYEFRRKKLAKVALKNFASIKLDKLAA
ncbi:hypothetical protein IJ135_02055 [Candidatus Saccharibacteria bacterium]|nr:hypothetical protein [Candidatus Saccharibacteria bacterium]